MGSPFCRRSNSQSPAKHQSHLRQPWGVPKILRTQQLRRHWPFVHLPRQRSGSLQRWQWKSLGLQKSRSRPNKLGSSLRYRTARCPLQGVLLPRLDSHNHQYQLISNPKDSGIWIVLSEKIVIYEHLKMNKKKYFFLTINIFLFLYRLFMRILKSLA